MGGLSLMTLPLFHNVPFRFNDLDRKQLKEICWSIYTLVNKLQFSFCHKNSHTVTASNQKTLNSFPRNKCRLFLRTLVINRVILKIEPQVNENYCSCPNGAACVVVSEWLRALVRMPRCAIKSRVVAIVLGGHHDAQTSSSYSSS